jgi:hypothetical protein
MTMRAALDKYSFLTSFWWSEKDFEGVLASLFDGATTNLHSSGNFQLG